MDVLEKVRKNSKQQYLLGFGLIFIISLSCYLSIDLINYHSVALILLLAVSLLAMLFEVLPIMLIAIGSALIWNFFFIPPRHTFHVGTPEDVLLFSMYFVIALMNAFFTTRIRNAESKVRDKEEREKTIKLYNTLLNSLSHELRTPISTIVGAIDTLKENSVKLSEENKMELYSEIDIAGHRLNRQVGNLLSMSRLESDFIQLQVDWYDMNELIHNVIQNNQDGCSNHTIIYESNDQLPLFKMDGALIEQILHNIIHNALQYTPPGSIIEIGVDHEESLCKIEIADNGKGFPEDKINAVFDKFYRLPNTATGGTGLGLSIAKGFAQAHNGSIKVENRLTGGAKFTVIIPAETTYLNTYENE
ncbi:hypothetical protein GCM10007103_32800 [Salinimicrobium marinum]|uniref:histidine kinase n=2 Tax=Salinimicrobium marinum TaxID=680283 RepID=A0A918W214_9FLAO|nr:hypothetical protein GCM10007103_32800 [Salinimicrobium marinum]